MRGNVLLSRLAARLITAGTLLALLLGSASGQSARGASQASAAGSLRVAFIDVLQGDSALLQASSGHTMLIDGGMQVVSYLLIDYLTRRGVNTIDVMVVSHADSDHVGGLVTVLQDPKITTRKIYYNGRSSGVQEWKDFLAAAAARGLTPQTINYPGAFTIGEMQVQVLNPAPGQPSIDNDDISLVLRVDHGQVHFLFPGDILGPGEQAVLGRNISPAAQILKVPHHGSGAGSSSDFLAQVQPKNSIISTSAYIPSDEATLQRLRNVGSAIWRTDMQGTIVVTSNGVGYTISEDEGEKIFLPVARR